MTPEIISVEQIVLGSILLERNAFDEVIQIIDSEEIFTLHEHKEVYRCLLEMRQERTPIDIITVVHHLRKKVTLQNIGGAYFISELTARVGSTANLLYHSMIIYQDWAQRVVAADSYDLALKVNNGTASIDEMAIHADKIKELLDVKSIVSNKPILDVMRSTMDEIAKATENKGVIGVPSGFFDIDRITAGFQRGEMTIIAARPSMGKTSLMMNMAKNTSERNGHKVGVFSLEMKSEALIKRMIASELEMDVQEVIKGSFNQYQKSRFVEVTDKIAKLPIFFNDEKMTVDSMEGLIKKLVLKHGVEIVMVDFLTLIEVKARNGRSREQEVAEIARTLKATAKNCDIPIVVLSQLSRENEKRGGKRPMLSDLRESGEIEQVADVVMFIHRPEYYSDKQMQDGTDSTGLAEVIFAKNRNGATGSINMRYKAHCTTFYDLESYPPSNFRPLKNDNEF